MSVLADGAAARGRHPDGAAGARRRARSTGGWPRLAMSLAPLAVLPLGGRRRRSLGVGRGAPRRAAAAHRPARGGRARARAPGGCTSTVSPTPPTGWPVPGERGPPAGGDAHRRRRPGRRRRAAAACCSVQAVALAGAARAVRRRGRCPDGRSRRGRQPRLPGRWPARGASRPPGATGWGAPLPARCRRSSRGGRGRGGGGGRSPRRVAWSRGGGRLGGRGRGAGVVARRRIGGVTGDVLGACVEVALAAYLVAQVVGG